ncbi:hypothetical protein JTM27_35800, partial [Pseudomonas aeruginosa]|nr:hypothetical protein [Pseudomonas aeruginosa]
TVSFLFHDIAIHLHLQYYHSPLDHHMLCSQYSVYLLLVFPEYIHPFEHLEDDYDNMQTYL